MDKEEKSTSEVMESNVPLAQDLIDEVILEEERKRNDAEVVAYRGGE